MHISHTTYVLTILQTLQDFLPSTPGGWKGPTGCSWGLLCLTSSFCLSVFPIITSGLFGAVGTWFDWKAVEAEIKEIYSCRAKTYNF